MFLFTLKHMCRFCCCVCVCMCMCMTVCVFVLFNVKLWDVQYTVCGEVLAGPRLMLITLLGKSAYFVFVSCRSVFKQPVRVAAHLRRCVVWFLFRKRGKRYVRLFVYVCVCVSKPPSSPIQHWLMFRA